MSEALEAVDPKEILDHVTTSGDPVSALDLFVKFSVGLSEMLRALGDQSCEHQIFYRRDSSTRYLFSSEQVDDSWKRLLPMEHEYRCDDGGRKESGLVGMDGDCVVRTLATANPKASYLQVYQGLSEIVADMAVQEFQYGLNVSSEGVSEDIYGPWLEERGWQRLDGQAVIDLTGGNGVPTVWEFINSKKKDWDKQVMILSTRERHERHLVAVVDKVIRDLSDCSEYLVEAAWMKATSRCDCEVS